MDDVLRKEIFRENLKRRHKGKKIIPAQYRMKFPESAEREYVRLANEYMAIEKDVLLKYIPELKRILNEGTQYNTDSRKDNEQKRKAARFSGIVDTFVQIGILFDSIQKELDSAFGLYDLRRKINSIANLDHKLTVAEWKKAVSRTLGIDILTDYYSGDFYKEMLEKWVSDNVDLIKTVPKNSLVSLKEKVYSDYMNGRSTTDIVKELQRQYGMDKRRARLIARDQTAKLNANITQNQQRDAGVSKYKWSTSRDGRVRKGDKMAGGVIDPMGDNHERLEGKIFRWDTPPLVDRKRGRACHPGEDYQCRCCAIPVFDIDELDLPV